MKPSNPWNSDIDLIPVRIDEKQYQQLLEEIAHIMYATYCQFHSKSDSVTLPIEADLKADTKTVNAIEGTESK